MTAEGLYVPADTSKQRTRLAIALLPASVIILMLTILMVFMIRIVPEFKAVFVEFEVVPLPVMTLFLIRVSDFFVRFWYLILLLIALVVPFALRWLTKLPAGVSIVVFVLSLGLGLVGALVAVAALFIPLMILVEGLQ